MSCFSRNIASFRKVKAIWYCWKIMMSFILTGYNVIESLYEISLLNIRDGNSACFVISVIITTFRFVVILSGQGQRCRWITAK